MDQGESRPIKPVGLKIIEHPKLQQWFKQGYAKQLSDGLWLHYTVICTLLKEAEDNATSCQSSDTQQSGRDPSSTHSQEGS